MIMGILPFEMMFCPKGTAGVSGYITKLAIFYPVASG
jgi:hypothetical protein